MTTEQMFQHTERHTKPSPMCCPESEEVTPLPIKLSAINGEVSTSKEFPMKTGPITYNIGERNRNFFGQPRNFNIPKVVALINGNTVQELVSKGDMYGYLGHDVRIEYGVLPAETNVSSVGNSKQILPIDPCLRMLWIKAYQDGTIEYEVEFLNNHLGKKAFEWFTNKIGGFSSVFTPTPENPTGYWGMDYVLIPNYDNNRGYSVMDSALYGVNINKLTSKQRYALLAAQATEKAVVMDSIMQKMTSLQEQVKTGHVMNQSLLADINHLQSVLDNAQTQLRDQKYLLKQFSLEQERHEPMLRLSADNWLSQSCNDVVLDGIRVASNGLNPALNKKEIDLLQGVFK